MLRKVFRPIRHLLENAGYHAVTTGYCVSFLLCCEGTYIKIFPRDAHKYLSNTSIRMWKEKKGASDRIMLTVIQRNRMWTELKGLRTVLNGRHWCNQQWTSWMYKYSKAVIFCSHITIPSITYQDIITLMMFNTRTIQTHFSQVFGQELPHAE